MNTIDLNEVDRIVDDYNAEEGALIQILLDVQKHYNWLPPETLRQVSERLDMPTTQVYRVASFFKALSLVPRGEHIVKVCLGTACHVRGGVGIMDRLSQVMDIEDGQTTEDMKFSLEKVNCLGCCALGPIITVDEKYHGKMSPEDVPEVLENYK